MSNPPSRYGSYPYQYANLADQDDESGGHQRISSLNSPDITPVPQNLRSPSPGARSQPTTTASTSRGRRSRMDSPISPLSPSGQERGFDWQGLESSRGSATSGSKTMEKKATSSAIPAATLNPQGQYKDVDLDSLLETPNRSSDPEGFRRGHTRGNSAVSVASSSGGGPTTPKRKSMTAALSERAFKSPILTKSVGSVASPGNSKKLQPSEIIDQRAEMTAQWGIYWYLPSLMIAVFIAGLIGAVGHHAFYKSLDGQPSNNQLSMVRIGTAFAFFVKANLVGAVVLAYRQRIWLTMRKKALKIKAIDALFGIIEDPTFFLTTPEIVKHAKVASMMALVTWLIPIASVLSPSSLTSEVRMVEFTNQTCEVPTLNFTAEIYYNFTAADANFGNSLAFYNYTDMVHRRGASTYDMPSFQHQRLASQAIYNHGPASPPTPCLGFNCTYSLTMLGPGYKCEDIDENSEVYDRAPPEIRPSNLAPNKMNIYYANVNNGDFLKPYNLSLEKYPGVDPNWAVGTFYWEPELWIGYSVNTSEPLGESYNVTSTWNNETVMNEWKYTKLVPKMFHCVHYHVEYTFNVSYINTMQSANVTNIKYIRPIVDTEFKLDDQGKIIPPDPSKFLRPGQDSYQLAAVYHSIGSHLRKFLAGRIWLDNSTIPITESQISMTNLVNSTTAFPFENLSERVKRLHEDILLNFLSSESPLIITAKEKVTCTNKRWLSVYKYYQKNLWIGYSIVVCVTLTSIIVGALALRSNGISSDTLFSRILVTTRNPTLDHLSRGACLGSDPFPRELEETKLRFGVWHEGGVSNITGLGLSGLDKPGHCAFGTVHETTEIVQGGLYAGLDVGRIGRKYEMQYKNYVVEEQEEEENERDVFYDCSDPDESEKPLLGYSRF